MQVIPTLSQVNGGVLRDTRQRTLAPNGRRGMLDAARAVADGRTELERRVDAIVYRYPIEREAA